MQPFASPPPATPAERKSGSIAGAMLGLFRAAKALLCGRTADEPQLQARRKRGESDKGATAPFRKMVRRFAKTGTATARGPYAALQPGQQEEPDTVEPGTAYGRVTAYLSDTLDWLNLWHDNEQHWADDQSLDDGFSAEQNQNFPQPS